MKKPIKVFYSELSKRFYATAHYRRDKKNPDVVIITGEKYDVTNDIAAAVIQHDLEFTVAEPEVKRG